MTAARRSGRLAILPADAVDDVRVGPAALRVLVAVGTHADGKTGWCYLKQRTLAARLGISRQAVSRQLQALALWGYLEIDEQHDFATKQQTGSRYRVHLDFVLADEYRRTAQPDVARPGNVMLRGAQPLDVAGGATSDVAGGATSGGCTINDFNERPERTTSKNGDTLPKPSPLRGEGFDAGAAKEQGDGVRPTTIGDDVVAALSAVPADLRAPEFHDAVEQALVALGFACDREVLVADRGDGQRGRLDLVARRGEERIAVELDSHTPRAKSVTKLRGVRDAARVIVLRHPEQGPMGQPDGIDVVIGVGQAAATTTPEQDVALTPATGRDRRLWDAARAALTVGWLPSNVEAIDRLELLGRGADGGLRLRAPPGMVGADRFRQKIVLALLEAGDNAARQAAIIESGR